MSSSTFVRNDADDGSGIYNLGTANVENSIVARVASSHNKCSNLGTFNVSGVNFSDDNSCPGFTQVTAAQLALGLLADNGGPTKTIALLAGSVAIDAAPDCTDYDGNPIPTDQRGVARPQGQACDVGAYEFQINTQPVAQCHDVTVQADANCSAAASIDNGSYDPDAGDTITVTQSPAGPYSLGPRR